MAPTAADLTEEGLVLGAQGKVDFGDSVPLKEGEVPVFWACGVTPQTALEAAALPVAVTHSPGYMMMCDLMDDELLVDEVRAPAPSANPAWQRTAGFLTGRVCPAQSVLPTFG